MADPVGVDSDEELPKLSLSGPDRALRLGQDRKGSGLLPKFGAEPIPCPEAERRAGGMPILTAQGLASCLSAPPRVPSGPSAAQGRVLAALGRPRHPGSGPLRPAEMSGAPYGARHKGAHPRLGIQPPRGRGAAGQGGRGVGFGGAAGVRGPCSPAGRSLSRAGAGHRWVRARSRAGAGRTPQAHGRDGLRGARPPPGSFLRVIGGLTSLGFLPRWAALR